MTADGKIATFERKREVISGKKDFERVDRLRASADAIMVGETTLKKDNPALCVKVKKGPVKVAVCKSFIPSRRSNFISKGDSRKIIFTTRKAGKKKINAIGKYADVFVLGKERVDLRKAVRKLAQLGIKRLMVEGGGGLNFEMIRLGLVDELYVYTAPMIFGGRNAPTLVDGKGFDYNKSLNLRIKDIERIDNGFLVKYKLVNK